jgi:hypothetical protein
VTTPYRLGDGGYAPDLPERGPCEEEGPCRIGVHHERGRKTGIPWGWLSVARCARHRRAFTLYPPGHVPYGRTAWADLAPDGSGIERGCGEEAVAPAEGYFGAARDAGRGERWARDSAPGLEDCVRSTQRRRVQRAQILLGLEAGQGLGAQVVAAVTGLAAGDLVEACGALVGTRSLVLRGGEIGRVLERLARQSGRALMDRFAVLGHVAGLWGAPYRWLPRPGLLLDLARPFRRRDVVGRRACPSPAAAGRSVNDIGARAPP